MYEYRVIPAPDRAQRNRALKSESDRFALTLAEAMNDLAAEGWEFQRTETLPMSERKGLWGRKTVMRTLMVFRRARPPAVVPAPIPARRKAEAAPLVLAEAAVPPAAAVRPEPRPESGPEARPESRPEPMFRPGAALRAEGARKYPPLRRVAPQDEGASSDDRPGG